MTHGRTTVAYPKSAAALVATVIIVLTATVAHADIPSEISVSQNGIFTGKNLHVIQKYGTNLAVRAKWGMSFIRLTVLMNASTTVTKNHGEVLDRSGIKEGDLIDAEGTLSDGVESIIINATSVRDISQESESKTISGRVRSISGTDLSFSLPNASFGITKIVLSASTPIKKGARSVEFSELRTGDKIISASGTYDYKTNTLHAYEVEVHQDQTIFIPRNFQGKLKSISGAELPAVLVLTIDGSDYTVYLKEGAVVMRANRSATSLVRYAVGDTVRVYGGIRETDFNEIDGEVARDISF
jgi:hypothetical protein